MWGPHEQKKSRVIWKAIPSPTQGTPECDDGSPNWVKTSREFCVTREQTRHVITKKHCLSLCLFSEISRMVVHSIQSDTTEQI